MFNSFEVNNKMIPVSNVLYIIKDKVFNGSMIDYIETFDHSNIGKPDPDAWGLIIYLHGIEDKWIRGVKFTDIKIINLKDNTIIDLK